MKPIAVTPMSIDDVFAEAQRKAEEFAKLPLEEQERRNLETEKILAKLNGTPGFMHIKLGGK